MKSKSVSSSPAFTFEIRPVILIAMLLGTFAAGYMTSCNQHIGKNAKDGTNVPAPSYASVEAPVAAPAAPVQLVPSEARASTWMNRPSEVHPAKGAFDGDFSTNWTESHAGRGEGQWVEAVYASPVRVTEIVVATGIIGGCGNQESPKFAKNSRLKTFRIVLSDGTEIKASAADGERCVIVPVPAKATKSVKLVVDTVWPGSAYRDLGIAEIKVMGTKL